MADEDNVSVGTLVSGILSDVQGLLRQEVALARQEVREEVSAARDAGMKFAIAAAVLGVGGLLLVLALSLGLADLLDWPDWAGYAVIGLILGISGSFLLSAAQRAAKQINPVPQKTVATVKENVEWVKDRTASDKV